MTNENIGPSRHYLMSDAKCRDGLEEANVKPLLGFLWDFSDDCRTVALRVIVDNSGATVNASRRVSCCYRAAAEVDVDVVIVERIPHQRGLRYICSGPGWNQFSRSRS